MILEIYSSYGKLVAEPMTLQAIENSISCESDEETNQDSEVVCAACTESFSCHEHVVDNEIPVEEQETEE